METVERRDTIGTTYLAPNGDTYRLVDFDTGVRDPGGEPVTRPIFDKFSARGGAAMGRFPLPDGSIRTVIPTPHRPARGSLFLAPDGVAYRLTGYLPDLESDQPDAEVPSYTVLLHNGSSGTLRENAELPEGSRLIWTPEPIPTYA